MVSIELSTDANLFDHIGAVRSLFEECLVSLGNDFCDFNCGRGSNGCRSVNSLLWMAAIFCETWWYCECPFGIGGGLLLCTGMNGEVGACVKLFFFVRPGETGGSLRSNEFFMFPNLLLQFAATLPCGEIDPRFGFIQDRRFSLFCLFKNAKYFWSPAVFTCNDGMLFLSTSWLACAWIARRTPFTDDDALLWTLVSVPFSSEHAYTLKSSVGWDFGISIVFARFIFNFRRENLFIGRAATPPLDTCEWHSEVSSSVSLFWFTLFLLVLPLCRCCPLALMWWRCWLSDDGALTLRRNTTFGSASSFGSAVATMKFRLSGGTISIDFENELLPFSRMWSRSAFRSLSNWRFSDFRRDSGSSSRIFWCSIDACPLLDDVPDDAKFSDSNFFCK